MSITKNSNTLPPVHYGLAFLTRVIATVAIFFFYFTLAEIAESAENFKEWFNELPTLECGPLDIEAKNLSEAWQQFSTVAMFPSVLVIGNDFSAERPFKFKEEKTECKAVLDALIAAYPNYTWTQDLETGVVWIYPEKIRFTDLMKDKIEITRDLKYARMQSDVLEPLGKLNEGKYAVKLLGTAFTNTFDYWISLNAGVYSLKHILGQCILANPTKSLFISQGSGGNFTILPINIVNNKKQLLPPALAQSFWRRYLDSKQEAAPNFDDVIKFLGSEDSTKRKAAQVYFESVIFASDVETLVAKGLPPDTLARATVSLIEIFVRTKDTTLTSAIKRLHELFENNYSSSGDPKIVLEAGLQLVRFEPEFGINQLTKRQFTKEDINFVRSYAQALTKITNDEKGKKMIKFLIGETLISQTGSNIAPITFSPSPFHLIK